LGAEFGEQFLSSAVWALCAAHDGSLWIGFSSGGVIQVSHGRLRNYSVAEGRQTFFYSARRVAQRIMAIHTYEDLLITYFVIIEIEKSSAGRNK
jgi:hypothetical protein